MDSVTINGIEYVPKIVNGNIRIVVLDRGFVYVGHVTEYDDHIEVKNARSIIRWGTSKHLAELVNGPLSETKLGDCCDFIAYRGSVVHMISVNQDKWI